MISTNSPYNDLKILCHPDKLKAILEGKRTAPLYVRIKPTNVCNQNCFYCAYANDKTTENRSVDCRQSIPWTKLEEIIEDLSEMGTKAITFSGGGDPLCYHHIYEALMMVKEKKIDYAMITNGQGLNTQNREALADAKWVRISLDSTDEQMYRTQRRVDTFVRVLNNIEKFVSEKNKECVLGINYVVTKENYKEVYNMCKMMHDMGANNIKFSPLLVRNGTQQYHDTLKKDVERQIERAKEEWEDAEFTIIDKYTNDEGLEKNYQKKYCRCCINEIFTVIGADSNVYYCHQRAYTEKGCIGSLENQSFKKLWFSDATTELLQGMDASKECNFRCVFDERNQLLNDLINMDRRHINFI